MGPRFGKHWPSMEVLKLSINDNFFRRSNYIKLKIKAEMICLKCVSWNFPSPSPSFRHIQETLMPCGMPQKTGNQSSSIQKPHHYWMYYLLSTLKRSVLKHKDFFNIVYSWYQLILYNTFFLMQLSHLWWPTHVAARYYFFYLIVLSWNGPQMAYGEAKLWLNSFSQGLFILSLRATAQTPHPPGHS